MGVVISNTFRKPQTSRLYAFGVVEWTQQVGMNPLHIPEVEELVRDDPKSTLFELRPWLMHHEISTGIHMLQGSLTHGWHLHETWRVIQECVVLEWCLAKELSL